MNPSMGAWCFVLQISDTITVADWHSNMNIGAFSYKFNIGK